MSVESHAAFGLDGITLPLERLLPIRQIKPTDFSFGKYRSIVASIREVGLIEPLMVHPQKGGTGMYLLLDGHMRHKALVEVGIAQAFCLVAKDDEAFTYNDKVNGLSLIQEHRMITRAIAQGLSEEQISKALAIDVRRLKASLSLLDGIDPEAVDVLKDKPITAGALRLFRKAKPLRQVDMAQLMAVSGNYTRAYAEALIVGTPPELLVAPRARKDRHGISEEESTRMRREMESLERDFRLHQDRFGENSLHLNATQRYVKRLLENAKVRKFVASRYPEVLEEFDELVALEAL